MNYYLQDARQYVGNCVLWWRKGGGYTTHIDEAELFDGSKTDLRATDVLWPVDLVLKGSSMQTDMQRLNHVEGAKEVTEAAYKKMTEDRSNWERII